ncbi:MAG: hypothetical protein JWO30_4368 [Fibrobacteres bacterium]|nr:hypothetical protein [Fibrobacterota bacterium]
MRLPHQSFPFLLAAALLSAPSVRAESSPPGKSGPHIYLTGAGLLLLAGGGAFAYYQNREADKDMKTYRGSAFTGNTVVYRDKVREHERYTWVGLAGAALGGILIVVSF